MPDDPAELVGEHPAMRELRELVARVGASPVRTIMLYGETGTGKSLVARMLHRLSPRSAARFVDVNCAAIPPALVESELFGHERGAFTGAVSRKQGLVETAHRGTLFLDEISELDLVLQAKLLGFLDTQSFRRVGGVDPITVDVRLVAATNRMLMPEVRERKFREDLFYRLQLVFIHVPPLRDRGDDVFLLFEHYLARIGRRYGRKPPQLSGEVRDAFRGYAWPGNVRELAHLAERLFVLFDAAVVTAAHLPTRMFAPAEMARPAPRGVPMLAEPAPAGTLEESVGAFERQLILAVLAREGGHLQRAAAALGVTRHALRHRMRKLGLGPEARAGSPTAH